MVKETPIAGEVPTFQRHLDLLRLVAIGCQSIVGVHQSMSWLSSHLDERAADPVVEATRTVIRSIVYKQRMRPTTAGNRHWPNVGLSNVSDALEYLRRAGYGIFAILFESLANKASTSQISDAALSKTELATLAYLAKGMKPAAIAAERHVSENTVRTQIKNLCGKLSVNSAQAAVARARVAGLLPPA
jgi:DNA-binding NarL/FixJ family response regulator